MKKLNQFFTVKYITSFALLGLVLSTLFIFFNLFNLYQANKFNNEVSNGESPSVFEQSFEARYSVAYWLAQKEMFKESTILFNALMKDADDNQKSALQYNIGNIFLKEV